MDGDRIRMALARIDAAAQRIEAASARPASALTGDPELQRRHDTLERESSAALSEIERLIGTLEA
jgi:hypothetical protein